MWELLRTVARSTLSALQPRRDLALENLALRQQLAVLRRTSSRPQLEDHDRLFWIALKCIWPVWDGVLQLVQPATVIKWHRAGFRFYWRRKSRQGRSGRPKIHPVIIELIRRMSRDNVTWGAPRIKSELALLGHDVAESTVAKYMVRHTKKPSQTWRTPSRTT